MRIHVDQLDPAPAPIEDEGLGCLRTDKGNLPLDELDVQAAITGLATHIQLTQGFRNPYAEPLEATYMFPLPPRAAVTAMRMEADGRVIEAELKERQQARADYDQAITEGKRASIAEEERPGVFTMRVGNILPAERVTVRLELAGELPFEDGSATFRFPLVVAPRYIPGTPLAGAQVGDGVASDTDAVPDASRISPPVLLPGFPNPVRLSVSVDVDPAGLPLAGVASSLHVTTTEESADGLRVRLNPGERADRDFILRLRYNDDSVASSLAVQPDEAGEGGTFLLTLLPPAAGNARRPRDVVLVLDRSGSMGGWKMVAARRAAARIVDTLSSSDRLAVLAFDNVVDSPFGLVEASDRNRFRAVEFLSGLTARGGTELLAPLRRAAELLAGDTERDRDLLLITDGQVGNEDQILRELTPRLVGVGPGFSGPVSTQRGVRVHTVGIDRAVNEGFLQRLAQLGGGRAELVESEDRLDEAMRHIHHRIATPLVTGLKLASDGLAVDLETLAPQPLPDLFAGAAVVLGGRYTGRADGTITVVGREGWATTVTASPGRNPGLGAVWARARIRDLEDRYVIGGSDGAALERQILDTSLRFSVLSRFTAFVAVDQRVVNEGGAVHRIIQPVESPAGWQLPAPSAGRGFHLTGAVQLGFQADSEDWVAGQDEVPLSAPRQDFAPEPIKAQVLPVSIDEELRLLRESSAKDVWERAGMLTALAGRLRVLVAGQTGEQAAILAKLADELEVPTSDPAEIERRWQHAIGALESLTAPPVAPRTRQTFWKR